MYQAGGKDSLYEECFHLIHSRLAVQPQNFATLLCLPKDILGTCLVQAIWHSRIH